MTGVVLMTEPLHPFLFLSAPPSLSVPFPGTRRERKSVLKAKELRAKWNSIV